MGLKWCASTIPSRNKSVCGEPLEAGCITVTRSTNVSAWTDRRSRGAIIATPLAVADPSRDRSLFMMDDSSTHTWRSLLVIGGFAAIVSVVYVVPSAAQTPQRPPPSSNPGATGSGIENADNSQTSPWLFAPVVSSNPKLGTAFGGLGAYLHTFDPASRVSMFGITYQYTSTDSSIAGAFARTSFGADHHRIVGIGAFGYIKNDYEDYLGTGQPLQTNDDLKAVAGRYLYRTVGNWFLGAQGNAADYQVLGETVEDDFVLETLGIRGFSSAALGAVVLRDSRDNEDMPTLGWFLNLNNLAYREAFGGSASFDAYRADFRGFWPHGDGHIFAVRQYNWLTHDAPSAAQATVILRGYKLGQYLAPYLSSIEGEERLSFNRRWGATLFAGLAALYGDSENPLTPLTRHNYPVGGAGIHYIIKPDKRMLINFEYAQGIEENRGVYLKFGYGW